MIKLLFARDNVDIDPEDGIDWTPRSDSPCDHQIFVILYLPEAQRSYGLIRAYVISDRSA